MIHMMTNNTAYIYTWPIIYHNQPIDRSTLQGCPKWLRFPCTEQLGNTDLQYLPISIESVSAVFIAPMEVALFSHIKVRMIVSKLNKRCVIQMIISMRQRGFTVRMRHSSRRGFPLIILDDSKLSARNVWIHAKLLGPIYPTIREHALWSSYTKLVTSLLQPHASIPPPQ